MGLVRRVVIGAVAVSALLGPVAAETRAQLTFDAKAARLQGNGQSLAPAEVYEQPRERHAAGDLVLEFTPRAVRAVRAANPTPVWKVEFKPSEGFQWLGNDRETVYLRKWVGAEGGDMRPEMPAAVHRMAIKDGGWLKAVDPDPEPPAGASVEIRGLEPLPTGGGAVLMTHRVAGNKVGSYRVAAIAGERVSWSKEFPTTGEPPKVGGRVLGPYGPAPFAPEVRPLSMAGGQVVACGGPMEPIVSLDAQTGKENWRLENVWEFERGFTGPALLQYFVSRGGDAEATMGREGKVDPARRKSLRETCSLIGGPLVVPYGRGGHRIFVAVARHDPRAVGYVAECRVYEISESGSPVAVAPVPRMILGSHYKLLNDGLLWGFEGSAFGKFVPTDQVEIVDNRVQGTDHLVRMEWYRQPPEVVADAPAAPAAWLSTGRAGNPVGLDGTLLARLPAGSFVEKEGDKVFHFPIEIIDLARGQSRRLTLDVPVGQAVEAPETNFIQRNGQYVTRGPYQLAIVGLEVTGKDLYLRLASQSGGQILRFDLAKMLP